MSSLVAAAVDRVDTDRYSVVLRLTLDEALLDARTPASASRIGYELGSQIEAFRRSCGLGYFPALGFCIERGAIDRELLDAFDAVHWLTVQLSRREVLRSLRSLMSDLRIHHAVSQAQTMPRVRVGSANASTALARHLCPNRLRLELSGRSRRPRANGDWIGREARVRLGDVFGQVEVCVQPMAR